MGIIHAKVVVEEYDVHKIYVPAQRRRGRKRHGAHYSISQFSPPHASAVPLLPPPPPLLASHRRYTATSVCTTWDSNAAPECTTTTPATSTPPFVTVARAEQPKKILGLRHADTGALVPLVDDKGAYVPEDTRNKIWIPSMKMWVGGPECVSK